MKCANFLIIIAERPAKKPVGILSNSMNCFSDICVKRHLLIFCANNIVSAFILAFTTFQFKFSNIKNESVRWAFLNKYFLYLQKLYCNEDF